MALQDSLRQLQNFDLADLDLNNIGSWPAAVKAIVMTLVFLVVIGAGYYLYLTDKQTALDQAQAQEQDLRADFESKSFRAANLEAYRQQKIEMETAFEGLLRQLPSDTEVPGLLEDITRTALDNELRIESIDLQSERRTEFYVELPIDIVVEGSYHQIGAFVSGVANLSRIVTLHDFTISPQSSADNLKMSIVAKTYRYLEEGSVMRMRRKRMATGTVTVLLSATLFGCGGGDFADLQAFKEEVEARPKGRIEPLPPFEQVPPFAYQAGDMRAPFEPPVLVKRVDGGDGPQVTPDFNRAKQYLEQYPIGSLQMVGTLAQSGREYALIQDADGGVHRVRSGDYMGTDHGRIQRIEESAIELIEIVPDGTGGWVQRTRTVSLGGGDRG